MARNFIIVYVHPERHLTAIFLAVSDREISLVHLLRVVIFSGFFSSSFRELLRQHIERVLRDGHFPAIVSRKNGDIAHVYFCSPSLLTVIPDELLPLLNHRCHFVNSPYAPTGTTSPQPSTVVPGLTIDLIFTR